MQIFEANLVFSGNLSRRQLTDTIVLHHRAGDGDVESIHATHLKNGWAGIGYHFYVRKNGEIWRGRPVDTVGAHAVGENSHTVGICFEGNFENEYMGTLQLDAGRELIAYVNEAYGGRLSVVGHRDVTATACPGSRFPITELLQRAEISNDYTVNNLLADGIITEENVKNWEAFLSGEAVTPAGYIRTLLDRYHEKLS